MAKKAEPTQNRMAIGQARVERRCLCEGCAACHGMEGYPCAALSEAMCGGTSNERCQWCR